MIRNGYRYRFFAGLASVACASLACADGWVDLVDETATRMPTSLNDPATSTADTEEKDYAWGDVDLDGDIDLVVVRKEPFTSTGKRTNVLFMNEGTNEGHAVNGVFVDRTDDLATDSDVSGDNGFLTPTNDRDVQLVDVDGDGWLDMVTATTLTDSQAKHLSHPRVYMNKGESGGIWQGFRYEDARIPQMHPTAGPRFCSVAAADLTGDGFPDLYFGDYDSGGGQILDYNNRLLINDGNGFFSDESTSRLTSEMTDSAFGAASEIADINNDGVPDVVKQTSLASPTHVAVTYNNTANEGFFNAYDTVYAEAPYFISVGDLNNDGRLDIVVVDDGNDRYLLNSGNGGDGLANFTPFSFGSPSGGFGGNALIRDLNNDGHQDVLITDVDVDISGCSRRMHVYRNLGNVPNVTLQEQGQIIPDNLLTGTHDVAVFDINGDGWLDLVVGRCSDTRVWINEPPIGLVFQYPTGVPAFITPDTSVDFDVSVEPFGGGTHDEGTGQIHISQSGGPYVSTSMQYLGNDTYRATLPATPCTEQLRFFVTAEMVGGVTFTDPPGGATEPFVVIAAAGTEISFRDDVEGDVSAWTIEGSVGSGAWEQADPIGTITGGDLAAPDDDATAGQGNVLAFVTENGVSGGAAGAADVDGGPVDLISPVVDLEGADATISYARWFYCSNAGTAEADYLEVAVSDDGGSTWVSIPEHTTGGTAGAWDTAAFVVGEYVTPSAEVRVRFRASDNPNNSITEAGIDNFNVELVLCGDPAPCAEDVDGSGDVAFNDLLAVLAAWGPCADCPEDIDGNGEVAFADLLALLAAWGPCE